MDFGTGCLLRKYGRETNLQWPAGSICPSHREILFEPCNLLTPRFPDVLLPQFTPKASHRSTPVHCFAPAIKTTRGLCRRSGLQFIRPTERRSAGFRCPLSLVRPGHCGAAQGFPIRGNGAWGGADSVSASSVDGAALVERSETLDSPQGIGSSPIV